MRGEVLGVERRRRWSDEDKLSIVSSVGIDGATVTQVACRCDVDLSRFCAAPSARLSHFSFECDRAFPAQC